ncbi:MAG: DnaJ domain-containing protein, partial [Clostridia bacterium]|nr:DnaJ domain-containing protein [Clostridia bacterium]
MADKSYYDTLGVSKTASADELKSAYRRLAKQYHPDLFAGKPDAEKKQAEEKFKEINHAYDVLSDPQKRAAYDQYGSENGPQGFGGGAGGFGGFGGGAGGFGLDMDDIINSFFGGFGGGGRSQSS